MKPELFRKGSRATCRNGSPYGLKGVCSRARLIETLEQRVMLSVSVVTNASFEQDPLGSVSHPTGWSISNGASCTIVNTGVAVGDKAAKLSGAVASGTILSQTIAPGSLTLGQTYTVICAVTFDSSSGPGSGTFKVYSDGRTAPFLMTR